MADTTTETHKENLGFQTEVRQLLDLVIHSLYSNPEIFLRELISNASDAVDKLRFEALTDDALYEGDAELKVRVAFDPEARTITVSDNGIGMSRQEVTENLGTIAKSGTRQFFERLTGDKAKDTQLIGQFGVGFYSSFIVADRVTVHTRRAGLGPEHAVRWESEGKGEFSVETVTREPRGTEVELHLREDQDEFLDGWRLRSIIRKFSDHISLPIEMPQQAAPAEGEGEEAAAGAPEWEVVNKATALWARAKHEISDDEYKELYRHVSHDFGEPLAWTHSQVEGAHEYTSLLYVPARAPFDLWDRNVRHGVKLYVRRVFIMDDADQLMPPYLRFVRGVVDSADLPLNISREILQHNRQVDAMRSGSVKKVLGLLEGLVKNEPEKYTTFWGEFGRVLKEGIIDDPANQERIAKLLRFASTHNDDGTQNVSLEDYVARMQAGQEHIYYLVADSWEAARSSPHLEIFGKQGIEVLLLSDTVDQWVTEHLSTFEGKTLKSVAKGRLDPKELGDEEAESRAKAAHREHRELIERLKTTLEERVKEVRVTTRLTRSPACLVSDEHDMDTHLQRLLAAAGQPVPGRMEQESDAARFGDWAQILFDQALLAEGGRPNDPGEFVRRLNDMFFVLAGAAPARDEAPAPAAEGGETPST